MHLRTILHHRCPLVLDKLATLMMITLLFNSVAFKSVDSTDPVAVGVMIHNRRFCDVKSARLAQSPLIKMPVVWGRPDPPWPLGMWRKRVSSLRNSPRFDKQ